MPFWTSDDLLGAGGLHVDGAEHRDAGKALHAGGVGHDDDVVLIGAEHGSALGFEDAEDFDGHIADADGLADGVFIGKEAVGDRLAENTDLGGGAGVGVGEHRAFRQVPLANGEVIDALAHDGGDPIVVAGHDLGAAADFRADGGHAGHFLFHGQGVFDGERAGAAEAGEDAAAVDAAGEDLDDVLAEGGDAGLDLGLGAIADADHGDDGANADDDAQHGQDGPQLVPAQGAEGDFEDDEVAHVQ